VGEREVWLEWDNCVVLGSGVLVGGMREQSARRALYLSQTDELHETRGATLPRCNTTVNGWNRK
jgi:hypothetical protein